MNVQDLLDVLNTIPDKTLPVVVCADHGQTPTDCGTIRITTVEDSSEYYMEFVEEEGDKVLLISD